MLKNYFKIAWRNLRKSKLYSAINIIGLATGMAVAMLIGLWIYDELSFDKKGTDNYDRIGMVKQLVNFGGGKTEYDVSPIPLGAYIRDHFPDFKRVSLMSGYGDMAFQVGDKLLSKPGVYVQPEFTEMMTLRMKSGNRQTLKDMHSILVSESLAKALFGTEEPMGKTIRMGNTQNVTIGGVYEDFPKNSSFNNYLFLGSWDLYVADQKQDETQWDSNSWYVYVQLKPGVTYEQASAKIKMSREAQGNYPKYKPEFFVHPMSKWHLYSDFKDGVNTGGLVTFVWLFGIIGVFVLLLACINFMNLSTARSERRAREVGIRKAIGSVRRQLIFQFLSESMLVVLLSFALALLLVQVSLPFFNHLSDKEMSVLWLNPLFWTMGIGFSLITGLVAGSYPALYLSSFSPVKVLKGTFKAGRFAAIPRRVLVTLQFTVSVMLIIGTIVVFRQVQYAKDIPTGYNRSSLIEMSVNTNDLRTNLKPIETDLMNTGAVTAFSKSSCPITANYGGTVDYRWKGKDPNTKQLMMANFVSIDFGKTVGWQLAEGRDFSKEMATDSSAMIINETAVKTMGFKHPLGEIVVLHGKPHTVIGVTKDMVRGDPFQTPAPSTYTLDSGFLASIEIKLAPSMGAHEALARIETVFKRYNPASPFVYRFVDEEYARKFMNEERIGNLATFFAALAIFISCLGLFGLSSFVAEQRTKEIGVRKVLGARLINVWGLLSKEFVLLVIISLVIAMPAAWYFMNKWLQNYEVHTKISWWIYAAAGFGALGITLFTVSFQAIKAGLANPVKSLRTE
ncbi:MAG: ABC transporter permease [Bacteroidetes bacterium]|nr:ABC transporter permease [Bacteroidota bacterium]